jgi:PAS domain S-box-containing protein
MPEKPPYEELEQRVKELEKEAMSYKLAEEARRENEEKLDAILCSIGDHMSMMNKDLDIIWANETATKIFGKDIIGKKCYSVYHQRREPCEPYPCLTLKAFQDGKIHEHDTEVIDKDGKIIHFHCTANVALRDREGKPTAVIEISRDITECKQAADKLKASLEEKEMLLKEVHHRVKNNMQVISSLLNLESMHIKDKEALEMFKESQNRVRSMALIHEKLYRSKDLTSVDIGGYIQDLTTSLARSYGARAATIKLNIDVRDIFLDITASIPCGLIINELVSNSLKHAFPDGREGAITIAMQRTNGDKIELIVSDNGIGFPEDMDFRKTKSLGMQVVITLVKQLGGAIELVRNTGTAFRVRFPQTNLST